MTEPLTERSGVRCRNCFSTIDVTGGKNIITKRWRKRTTLEKVEVFFGRPLSSFIVNCPNCKAKVWYNEEDIVPIASNWAQEKERYEDRIRELEGQLKEVKADAKVLAQAAHQNLPMEEPDVPSNVPKEANEPILKKKDERPSYLV